MKRTLFWGKRPSIWGKRPSAIATVARAVIPFVVVLTFALTVGAALTIGGFLLAAVRRQSRSRKALSDRYMLPEGYADFDSRIAIVKRAS